VPSYALGVAKVVVDCKLQAPLVRGSTNLIALPDSLLWPKATSFALTWHASSCVHPSVAPLFASIADRPSVGLGSAPDFFVCDFSQNLRTMAMEADVGAGGSDGVWALLTDVTADTREGHHPLASKLSANDRWELLLWMAVQCAVEWHRVEVTSSQEDFSRYQETLCRVRALAPFIEALPDAEGDRWSVLGERHREAPAEAPTGEMPEATARDGAREGASGAAPAARVLLLRSLFGFDLWGRLGGVELHGRAPSTTAVVPARMLATCSCTAALPCLNRGANLFPEHFTRASLVLIWDWFLLEVVWALPPTVLWATIQEPISRSARPRILRALTGLRQAGSGDRGSVDGGRIHDGASGIVAFEAALLQSVLDATQVERLIEEMDDIDEARRLAAEREAHAQRLANEARRRMANEARERERQIREQRRQRESMERAERLAREAHEREQQEYELERQRREGNVEQPQPRRGEGAPGLHRDDPDPRRTSLPPPPPGTVGVEGTQRAQRPNPSNPESDGLQQDDRRRYLRSGANGPPPPPPLPPTGEYEILETPLDAPWRALDSLGVPGVFRRAFGGGAGGGAGVRRTAPTVREAQIKAKLTRFMAGMRALERQHAAAGNGATTSATQPFPPLLSEFIVWAGDMLSGEEDQSGDGPSRVAHSGSGSSSRGGRSTAAAVEAAARQYVGGGGSSGSRNGKQRAPGASKKGACDDEQEDVCSICQEDLADMEVREELGEVMETSCGHRFHAVCYARVLETSEYEPVCPMCRSGNLSVRFSG
jgi:hypothetical protein